MERVRLMVIGAINFYVTASYEVFDGVTAAATLNYMVLNGNSVSYWFFRGWLRSG